MTPSQEAKFEKMIDKVNEIHTSIALINREIQHYKLKVDEHKIKISEFEADKNKILGWKSAIVMIAGLLGGAVASWVKDHLN